MISTYSDILVNILFVLILGTASLTTMQKTISTLLSLYGLQSLFIALISFILFVRVDSYVLLALALLTVASKVLVIPYMLNRVRLEMPAKRDSEFRYLTPVAAMLVELGLIFLVYNTFRKIVPFSPDNLFFLGAVIGVSLSLMGMLIIFTRKMVVTKVIGYLSMENGILLFGLFMAELPFIIELLIIVDLIIFILLATVLAFGIDSTEEDFRRKLDTFTSWFKR